MDLIMTSLVQKNSRVRPIRVLHVVGKMSRGGVENWLMHVLRHTDRNAIHMDFLVHTDAPGVYDEEIREFGSDVIPCLRPSRPWNYAANFRRLLQEREPYDVVHSHVHHFSGFVLRLAKQAGIPARIAHSHIDCSAVEARAGFVRSRYLALMKHWIRSNATRGLAASKEAAADLFSPSWTRDDRWEVLHYAIDLGPFQAEIDRDAVRDELGLPRDALVVGHAGRFFEQKNHAFLAEIAAEFCRLEPRARLLLVGDGPLRPQIERLVAQLGIEDRVVFAGHRGDVPRLMKGAMDVFTMPSFHEGLPVAAIEAQAAGLPCILSDAISAETVLNEDLGCRLSLGEPASVWAQSILEKGRARPDPTQALRFVEQSEFAIRNSRIHRVYQNLGPN
jgi:glycosyltransferase involved in cell wall biosynthesis